MSRGNSTINSQTANISDLKNSKILTLFSASLAMLKKPSTPTTTTRQTQNHKANQKTQKQIPGEVVHKK
jgi:hypothetical protein